MANFFELNQKRSSLLVELQKTEQEMRLLPFQQALCSVDPEVRPKEIPVSGEAADRLVLLRLNLIPESAVLLWTDRFWEKDKCLGNGCYRTDFQCAGMVSGKGLSAVVNNFTLFDLKDLTDELKDRLLRLTRNRGIRHVFGFDLSRGQVCLNSPRPTDQKVLLLDVRSHSHFEQELHGRGTIRQAWSWISFVDWDHYDQG